VEPIKQREKHFFYSTWVAPINSLVLTKPSFALLRRSNHIVGLLASNVLCVEPIKQREKHFFYSIWVSPINSQVLNKTFLFSATQIHANRWSSRQVVFCEWNTRKTPQKNISTPI